MYSAVKIGLGVFSGEGGLEDTTTLQKVPHPGPAFDTRHEISESRMALGLDDLALLFRFPDMLAVACVIHQAPSGGAKKQRRFP